MHTPRFVRRLLAALCLLASQLQAPAAIAAPPRVVASIAPVHGLVAAVMDGVGSPALLLPAGASPHAHVLRPSQLHELERAALVIWIGEALEPYLARVLSGRGNARRTIALMDAAGVRVLPARSGGLLSTGVGTPVTDGAGQHSHAHADPHLWLDPHNARAIVALAARELSALDAANVRRYADNAARATARIDELERELAQRLQPLREAPYVVFHDAYQGFEKSFGLSPVAVVSVAPGRAPGARRLGEIRERIVATGARCVFAEPQFEPRLVGTIIEGTGARSGVLDPLGAGIAPGPDAWFELMQALADALHACLSPR
jgi:zinc transport system substrate-binding protein